MTEPGSASALMERLAAMRKIDAHTHVLTADAETLDGLGKTLERQALRWLDICWYDSDGSLPKQVAAARAARGRLPGRVDWLTAFSLDGFDRADWAEKAIAEVEAGRAAGALGVKVWKNIGMELRDPEGRPARHGGASSAPQGAWVMIDDPRFDPVLDRIEKLDMTLTAHIGEPRNCWLPLDRMTVAGDREYFSEHPQYHGLLHPEMPGYQAQIDARDRMQARHPGLRVVGCHFASLEWDVAEIAARLDRFPRLAVDTAARICHLQIQNRELVRGFLLRYQDRILYGTDAIMMQGTVRTDTGISSLEAAYEADLRWLGTDETVEAPVVGPGFQSRGLGLPFPVMERLFRENARSWYPGLA
jgi:predicted TIM-barrel fold metal-dependent hydrolase